MIVCSLPRCGATKFCLDLERDTKIKFVGELNPIHINNSTKQTHHETNFQPSFTPSEFATYLHNHKGYIVLVNVNSYMLLPEASFVMLRKNMRNAALSYANFLIKMYPGIKPAAILHQIQIMRLDQIGIVSYLKSYPKPIVWYEEYYGDIKSETPLLNKYRNKDLIIKGINQHYGEY